jgi:hypothetical protein
MGEQPHRDVKPANLLVRDGYLQLVDVSSLDEVAGAFAAAVGLTIPTELQAKMEADGRPLLDRFRQLAPARRRISIQRWSAQRLTLTAAATVGALLAPGCSSIRCGPA